MFPCYPDCGVARTCPVTGTCNQPCVRQCPDSEVVIRPSPIAVTMPGPIMSTFPQYSGVGAMGAPVVGPRYGGAFGWGGYGGGYGGYWGYPGYWGYGGYPGYCGYGGVCGTGVSCHRYLSGNCAPC